MAAVTQLHDWIAPRSDQPAEVLGSATRLLQLQLGTTHRLYSAGVLWVYYNIRNTPVMCVFTEHVARTADMSQAQHPPECISVGLQ